MKLFKIVLISLFFTTPLIAQSEEINEPYPLKYFALRDVVSNVLLSPNGKYLGLMKIPTLDGNPVLEIYDAENMTKKPYVVGAASMEIITFGWVSNDSLVMRFRHRVSDKIAGFNRDTYKYAIAKLDVRKKKLKEFKEANANIASFLPAKTNKIILAFSPNEGKGASGNKNRARFSPRDYYELDVKTGRKKLLMRGNRRVGRIQFDGEGNPFTAQGFDRQTDEFLYFHREKGASEWNEIFRIHEDSFENFGIAGVDETKPHSLLVIANNGKDKQALWEFDTKTKSFGNIVYGRNDFEVTAVRYHSNPWQNPDTIVGVAYRSDRTHIEYFDGVEHATYQQLRQIIPNVHNLRITSRSKNGKDLTIYNSGPRDPGTYFLLKNGKLQTIGSKQPLLKSENLADVKYIKYTTRDGRKLRAYVTVPNTKGPHPTIVLPHGGPFVQEVVGYDEWGQMLANNGYLVIQPQYRGSQGYGLDYFKSAFIDGGQGGYKMQDDKDDAVNHLVKKGWVDADRVAMFGWSYGGYAALVAASRTPQIYQCVIAGAAVADNIMQLNYYRDRLRGSGKISQERFWLDSKSPKNDVADVNVPILLIHGSVDQRVPIDHAHNYRDQLEKLGKSYKYVELDGADHFSSTLFYRHQIKLYESIISYLKDDCGKDGI